MAVEIVWRPQARKDLLDIHLFIALDSPEAAERLYERIQAKVEVLAEHPRLGPRRPDISPSTRIVVEGPYLILYETHPDVDQDPIDGVEMSVSFMVGAI